MGKEDSKSESTVKGMKPGHRTQDTRWNNAKAEFESRDSAIHITTHTYTMGSWNREWSLGETIYPKLKESPSQMMTLGAVAADTL